MDGEYSLIHIPKGNPGDRSQASGEQGSIEEPLLLADRPLNNRENIYGSRYPASGHYFLIVSDSLPCRWLSARYGLLGSHRRRTGVLQLEAVRN